MKMNPEKCHVIVFGNTIKYDNNFQIKIDHSFVIPENQVTLLGITLDSKLDFNSHISNMCKEASKKISALLRVAKYLNKSQKALLINSFFYSHFNYCPLIWMFSSKIYIEFIRI